MNHCKVCNYPNDYISDGEDYTCYQCRPTTPPTTPPRVSVTNKDNRGTLSLQGFYNRELGIAPYNADNWTRIEIKITDTIRFLVHTNSNGISTLHDRPFCGMIVAEGGFLCVRHSDMLGWDWNYEMS